jgi:hypothetical protein
MPDYVTTAANFEATGASLTPSELEARPIHRPHLNVDAGVEELIPTPTTH